MKIEFYLDYLCPKCYLQHLVLENLIDSNQIDKNILIYRSFEMVDDESFDANLSYAEFISRYKHLPIEEVNEFLSDTQIHIKLFPIHSVHKMAHLAKKMKLSYEFNKAVFHKIYIDKIDLSLIHELKQLAIEIGLPEQEVHEVLCSKKYSEAVISNKENGMLKGVDTLPFLRINQTQKLQGIQSENDILKALQDTRIKLDNEHCVGENCSRKKLYYKI